MAIDYGFIDSMLNVLLPLKNLVFVVVIWITASPGVNQSDEETFFELRIKIMITMGELSQITQHY